MAKILRLSILVYATLIGFLGNAVAYEQMRGSVQSDMNLTLEKAIEIARQEVARLGHKIEDMEVTAYEDNREWRKHVESNPRWEEDNRDIASKLEKRKFWAVHFVLKPSPNEWILGGGLWVFVDKADGTIITTAVEE